MAAPRPEETAVNSWEELLRKMLPEGAPLPDEEHLDYSISVDYTGPSPYFNRSISPMIPKTKFTTFPKQTLSLTPRNGAVWKSHSSSESTDLNNKGFSVSSSEFYDSFDKTIENADELSGDRKDFWRCHGETDKLGDNRVSSPESNRKVCERCKKKKNGLFRETEGCIVCGAEYCMKCVLKAMGTMPEGRKCITCTGNPIDEANREKLGKCSRALLKLCGRSEIKQIMKLEVECKANQVRPYQVIVNGGPLKEKELMELLTCAAPPNNLKPGRYWYDKDSGLWGKEGEKPRKIISPNLDVGGKLQIDASSGNTSVYMNGREITKVELKVLKLAKVLCPRDSHFWLYEDGSYEEEGQNNIKGCIWEKASIRFLSSLFSLPVPPGNPRCMKDQHALYSAGLRPEVEQSNVKKFLLLWSEGSGMGTIFKQVKLLYTDKFSVEELLNIRRTIQRNTCRYICDVLEWREHFEEEALKKVPAFLGADKFAQGKKDDELSKGCIYSVSEKIQQYSDWFLDLMATGEIDANFPAAAPIIIDLWKDPAIQETYKRREELQFLPDVTKYFLDRVVEMSSYDYDLSERDILFAEGVSPCKGLAWMDFAFDNRSVVSELLDGNSEVRQPSSTYQLIQLTNGLFNSHRCLEMLENVTAVIFCVSLSDYDQITIQSNGILQNKILASKDLLEAAAGHSCFRGKPFILLLNNDHFEDKIKEIPLTICDWFRGFNPLKTHRKNTSLAQQAYHYVASKFKELHRSTTGRKLYVWPVQAIEKRSVDEAFRYIHEIIQWEEMNEEFYSSTSDSISSAEMSSPPCTH